MLANTALRVSDILETIDRLLHPTNALYCVLPYRLHCRRIGKATFIFIDTSTVSSAVAAASVAAKNRDTDLGHSKNGEIGDG